MQIYKITMSLVVSVIIGCLQVANAAMDLTKEAEKYRQYVIGQIDSLLSDTERFVGALKKEMLNKQRQFIPLLECIMNAVSL